MVTCSCVGVRHLFRAARECLSKSLHSVDVSGDTYIYICREGRHHISKASAEIVQCANE